MKSENTERARTTPVSNPSGVAALSLRGAGVLAARYGLSTLVNVANMFVLTWWIGPRAYGLFITAVALTTFLASISRAGLDTYLVRCEEASDRNLYNTVFTLTLAISVALMALGALAAPLLSRWYHDGTVVAPYLVLLLTVPMIGLTGPPMARLERELRFQTVATIEFIGQLLSFLVSGVLAWRGMTVWAPVSGHVAWQVFTLLAAYLAAGWAPRLRITLPEWRRILNFAVGYSASVRVWQLRGLVNPLIVGRVAGAEAVACVALAIRFAEGLSFVRTAAGRVALAALSRLRGDLVQCRSALEKGMRLQVLGLAPLLCGFSLVAPVLLPRLLGHRWEPALQVFPFVAAAVLINSVFNLEASALFVLGRQWSVTRSYAWHIGLLAAGTLFLVPHLGLAGYGWAELAACVAYWGLHADLKQVMPFSYGTLGPWLASCCLALLGAAFPGHVTLLAWMPVAAGCLFWYLHFASSPGFSNSAAITTAATPLAPVLGHARRTTLFRHAFKFLD